MNTNNYDEIQIERQERIDRYVLGRMTEDEMIQFEQDTSQDPELKEQALFTQRVRKVITSREEKLAKIREWNGEGKNKQKTIYWISSIAAVLVIGFLLGQLFNIGEGKDGLPTYFEPDMTTVRGGGR